MEASNNKYSAADVATALKAAHGIKAMAARALGCERRTITSYIRRYEVVRRAYEDATNELLDIAESHLIDGVKAGEWDAVKYYLTSKGKARGYGSPRVAEAVERELVEMLRRLKAQLPADVYGQVVGVLGGDK